MNFYLYMFLQNSLIAQNTREIHKILQILIQMYTLNVFSIPHVDFNNSVMVNKHFIML